MRPELRACLRHLPDAETFRRRRPRCPRPARRLKQDSSNRRPSPATATFSARFPAFNVASYGQGAIGYGLAMRGYPNSEHGRDIAYFIDGVPVNEISSIHTPNYADLNVLIPETVKSIEVIRGPFSVEAGDFNLGGAVFITTKSSDPYAGFSFSGGSYRHGARSGDLWIEHRQLSSPTSSLKAIPRTAIAITAISTAITPSIK